MRHAGPLLIAFFLMMSLSYSAMAEQPLSGYQQQIFNEVKTGLEGVADAVKEARTKLEAGDASGAAGTYNTAVRNYNVLLRRFSQLPAENADVVDLRKKAQTLGAELKETGAAIKAGPSEKPSNKQGNDSSGKPAPAPSVKLDYRQRDTLKNVRFYLAEVDPRANRIFELTSGKLDAEAIGEALNLMKFVNQRMGYAVKGLNSLPGNNAEVAAESTRYNDLLKKLIAAHDAIEKAAPQADRQVAARNEQMGDDLAMVDSWSKNLGNPQFLFDSRPDDAIAVVGQLPQMHEAINTMLTRWEARAAEKPNDKNAADMVRKLKYVNGQITDLDNYQKELAKALPGRISADLAAVNKLIAAGVSERRPLYFGPQSGIAQQLGFAQEKVKILVAIDPAAGESAQKSLEATREKSLAAQKALAEDIIKSNKKPAERYTGADLEDLRQRVTVAWKDAHPNTEVLVVIFNTEGWSRTTRWDWSKGNHGFGKVDYDHIQPKLFYKLDETYAVEMPVDVYKDYMKDGRITVKPWEMEKEPPVSRTYLLANLK